MADNSWIPFAGTALGAVIALGGTVLAGARNDRGQRRRDRETDRIRTYVDFAVALDTAHAALREVARTAADDPGRYVAGSSAVQASGLYGVRERLLMSASRALVTAGETAFGRLIDIRNAVRAGRCGPAGECTTCITRSPRHCGRSGSLPGSSSARTP